MSRETEQPEPTERFDPDRLVELAIEPVDGEARSQLESVRRLSDAAYEGDAKAFEGLYMAGVLQPDESVLEAVEDALLDLCERGRSPKDQGLAQAARFRIRSDR